MILQLRRRLLLNRDFGRRFEEECKRLRAPNVTLNFPGRHGQVTRRKLVSSYMPAFDKSCRDIASHSQPIETQGIRPTLDELKGDYGAVLKAREPHNV